MLSLILSAPSFLPSASVPVPWLCESKPYPSSNHRQDFYQVGLFQRHLMRRHFLLICIFTLFSIVCRYAETHQIQPTAQRLLDLFGGSPWKIAALKEGPLPRLWFCSAWSRDSISPWIIHPEELHAPCGQHPAAKSELPEESPEGTSEHNQNCQ